MTAAHAYELPPDDTAPAGAVRGATHGDVVYLTRRGEPIAAVVPLDVAAAGEAAVTALQDAADIRAARAALAEPGASVPLAQVLADYDDDLAAYSDDER